MSFQKTVLIIGAIVLSVMLFFIGLAMQGLKKSQQYPPKYRHVLIIGQKIVMMSVLLIPI